MLSYKHVFDESDADHQGDSTKSHHGDKDDKRLLMLETCLSNVCLSYFVATSCGGFCG